MGEPARGGGAHPHRRDGRRGPLSHPGLPDLARREALFADSHLIGPAFCRAYAAMVDGWLVELLGDEDGVALAAVGGYGRGELCPGSDIDVLLVHTGGRDVAEIAKRIWYPLWDARLKVGHATRSLKEALSLADRELDVATAAIDARAVAGDAALTAQLVEGVSRRWQKRSARWLDALATSVEERHARAGEVAFLLEPDLKEGRGGLRDVHALRWAEAARRILLPDDHVALDKAHDVLLSARVELQRRTGKAGNQLLLQEQDSVAEALGDADADVLMSRVSGAARTIAWTSDEAWARIRSSLRGPSGRLAGGDRPLGPGLVLREGAVHLSGDARPAADPTLLLRAAATAAQAGAPIDRESLDRLAAEAVGPGDPWPEAARAALVALLGTGAAAVTVMEALDQRGLLERVLPEWSRVRSRPQRNAYHRFTVDRHLCEAAAEAAHLTRQVARPDLLLVVAWLHDLGKGWPGDHTDRGVELMGVVGPRLGFDVADVGVLCDLVRHHLLLADTATRRDLADPSTAEAVAVAVGSQGTLELLAALTEADSKATGESAWSPWREELLRDLVARTVRVLQGDRRHADPDAPAGARRRLAQRAGRRLVDTKASLVVMPEGPELVVAAPDRPGLFSRVAGTLALHGMEVLAAEAWSDDGLAFEVFRADPVPGRRPDWASFERELAAVLAGQVSLEARLAKRARDYAGRRRPSAPVPEEPRVLVDNEASATSTVVEVRAADAIGLLYRITSALAGLDLDVGHATVQTLGHEVVDTFYVRLQSGQKLPSGSVDALRSAVLAELG